MNFNNKNVLVCGVARSGICASLMLKKLGANVTIQDLKTKDLIEEIDILEQNNINLFLGKNPDSNLIDKMDLMVLSPGIPTYLDFVTYAKSKIPVISEIELGYLFCKAPIIALTGTNGKTTTTSLLGHILKSYKKTYVAGNIGVPFSNYALDIEEDSVVVLELSSFQLETIDKFNPKISAILNITEDHLNVHKTMENYVLAKQNIFKNQTEDDFLILNYDDNYCKQMGKKSKAKPVYFSSKHKLKSGAYLKDNVIYVNEQPFINTNDIQILGTHNIENVMASILICLCYNVPKDVIINGIKSFKGVEHRIEYVATKKGVDYYNDSKGTNPDATIKAINAMKKPTYLIVGGYEKNTDFLPMINHFKNKVVTAVIIGDVKMRLANDCKKSGFLNYVVKNNFLDAINFCYENAKQGECILLSPACASFDMFKDYQERGNVFKAYIKDLKE